MIDITGKIGPSSATFSNPEWPMYSYERPACILWNAIANGLIAKGWSEYQLKKWLQSKDTRYALDGILGDKLEALGEEYAATFLMKS